MKYIYSIIFVFCSQLLICQSLSDLDMKNGFRDFKLGSTHSQIKNISREENQYSKNPNVKSYIYNGQDIKTVFNVEVETIKLAFFRDKLFSIIVYFDDVNSKNQFELIEFNALKSSLENLYGYNWKPASTSLADLNGVIWSGNKVTLELNRIYYSEDSFYSGFLHIFDKALIKKMYESEY